MRLKLKVIYDKIQKYNYVLGKVAVPDPVTQKPGRELHCKKTYAGSPSGYDRAHLLFFPEMIKNVCGYLSKI